MKLKQSSVLKREELAQLLKSLAESIRDGKIICGSYSDNIPQDIAVKFKTKEKDGYSKFKISFKWPSFQTSDIVINSIATKPIVSYKEAKKQFSFALKSINQMLSSGKLPSSKQAKELGNKVEASISLSKSKLLMGMKALKEEVIRLINAINARDYDKANNSIINLYKLKEHYHRQFK